MSESIVLMTIGPLLTIVPNIPPLFVGQPGAISFSATGAEGLLRWTLVSIDLPGEWDAALTITDGVASLDAATLANPGSFSVRVRLSDATRIPVEQTFAVRIVALPIEVSGTLDAWTVTVAIDDVLTLSGGSGTYASVTTQSGALPAGASVALVGDELQFAGSPTGTGAWSVVLRVTDSAGAYLDIPLSGTVTALPLTITGGPLDDAVEGEAYSDTLAISGGVPPYTLGTVSGVPAGLSVDIDGSTIEITGTPDAGEAADSPFALSIEVEDAEAETEVYTQSFVVELGDFATWDTTYKSAPAVLSVDDTKLTADTAAAGTYASTRSTVPLSGDVYFSALVGTNALGGVAGVGVADENAPDLSDAAQWTGAAGSGGGSIGYWGPNSSVWVNGSAAHTTAHTVDPQGIEIAVRVTSRRVWIRRSGEGWIGGGDPAANTTPTATLSGTGDIFAAATVTKSGATSLRYVTLHSKPADITGTPPSGFSAGIPA